MLCLDRSRRSPAHSTRSLCAKRPREEAVPILQVRDAAGTHRPRSIGAKYDHLDKVCPNSVYSCWMYRTSVLVEVPWKGSVFAQEVASATRAYDIHLLPLLLTSRDVTGLASHSFGAHVSPLMHNRVLSRSHHCRCVVPWTHAAAPPSSVTVIQSTSYGTTIQALGASFQPCF